MLNQEQKIKNSVKENKSGIEDFAADFYSIQVLDESLMNSQEIEESIYILEETLNILSSSDNHYCEEVGFPEFKSICGQFLKYIEDGSMVETEKVNAIHEHISHIYTRSLNYISKDQDLINYVDSGKADYVVAAKMITNYYFSKSLDVAKEEKLLKVISKHDGTDKVLRLTMTESVKNQLKNIVDDYAQSLSELSYNKKPPISRAMKKLFD